eukprot:11739460-Ditylum_brightwellii.AAC.2
MPGCMSSNESIDIALIDIFKYHVQNRLSWDGFLVIQKFLGEIHKCVRFLEGHSVPLSLAVSPPPPTGPHLPAPPTNKHSI